MLTVAEDIEVHMDIAVADIVAVMDIGELIITAAGISGLTVADSIAVTIMAIMVIMVPASVLALAGDIRISGYTLVYYREGTIDSIGTQTHTTITAALSTGHTMAGMK
jgi:hypothetical protein